MPSFLTTTAQQLTWKGYFNIFFSFSFCCLKTGWRGNEIAAPPPLSLSLKFLLRTIIVPLWQISSLSLSLSLCIVRSSVAGSPRPSRCPSPANFLSLSLSLWPDLLLQKKGEKFLATSHSGGSQCLILFHFILIFCFLMPIIHITSD